MKLFRSMRRAALPVLVYSVLACSGDGGTPPTRVDVPQSSASGTAGAVFSAPSDTTKIASGPSRILGTVVLITFTPSNGQPVDTSRVAPLGGARLSLLQRVEQGGTVSLVPYAHVVADANGAFAFEQVQSGYYVIRGEGPEGTSYPSAQAYIATSVSEIEVHFRLVKNT